MSDAELTAAAEEAKEEAAEETVEEPQEEQEEEEPSAEEQEESAEEPQYDEDGLPLNHAARSELGRKVAAYHRRLDMLEEKLGKLDEFDSKINTLIQYLNKPEEEEEIDPDMPMTLRDFVRIQQRTQQQQAQLAEAYNNAYVSKITAMARDVDEEYLQAVMEEMKNITYTPTADPERDAELNFLRAERQLLKKEMGAKKNPLRGESPGGTLKKQPTTKTGKPLPKLNAAAEDYLAYIRYTDGEEAALKARKDLA